MSCLKVGSFLAKALPLCSSRTVCRSSALPLLFPNSSRSLHCTSTTLNMYFSKEHEWVKVAGDIGTIGISAHAQAELGEVVFCELPEVGEEFTQEDVFGSVESVKAASDMVMPVSGTVVEVNQTLEDNPALINERPEEDAWIIKVQLSDATELTTLMSPEAYQEFCE